MRSNLRKTLKNTLSAMFLLAVFSMTFLLITSCEKELEETRITKSKISGYVQKGPFVNGTQILMAELNSDLEQTGKIFSTQIVSNTGAFEINDVALSSQFVEFSANGFYFNEVTGEVSVAPLNLFALSDITDISSVNINLLTHLEKRRVEKLINENLGFSNAKKQAQGEILAMFGFENTNMQESENLNIAIDHEDNAILLAISIILQGNRSVGDLTELLAEISSGLRETGTLDNETLHENLRTSALQLNLPEIRENLINRYQTLGIEASIPDFEDYIAAFLSFTAGEPFASTQNAEGISTTGAILTGIVNPNSAPTEVTFEYGITTDYGQVIIAHQSPFEGNMIVPVQATIGSLQPATTYHFRVKAENEHGVFVGQNRSFTTLGEASDAVTNPASDITLNTAILNGRVNPNHLSTNVIFEYGTSTDFYGEIAAIQSPVNGHDHVDVNALLEGLEPGTIYYYRVKAENELGTSYANIMEFTTLGEKPAATAGNAEAMETTAILSGAVNPNLLSTMVTFQWGTSGLFQYSALAEQSPVTGGSFVNVSTAITGLQANTEYQFRIKAENQVGTTLSDEKSFKTFNGTVTDLDGNAYPTVIVGTQEWIARNLQTTKYSNGSVITQGPENNEEWAGLSEGAHTIYPHSQLPGIDSDEEMVNAYGLLYNFYAVSDNRNICPAGWRVPNMDDWFILAEFLDPNLSINNGYWTTSAGASHALRSIRTEPDAHPRWPQPNAGANNSTSFSAVPSPFRAENGPFYFWDNSNIAVFWSNSFVPDNTDFGESVYLYSSQAQFQKGEMFTFSNAWPVRCVKE